MHLTPLLARRTYNAHVESESEDHHAAEPQNPVHKQVGPGAILLPAAAAQHARERRRAAVGCRGTGGGGGLVELGEVRRLDGAGGARACRCSG